MHDGDSGSFGRILQTTSLKALVAAALVSAGLTGGVAGPVDAYSIRGAADRPIELRSPRHDALEEEGSIILSWSRAANAAEYVVFVAAAPLDGRSADELLADAGVSRTTTAATAIALQDVLRGPEGTTAYSWVVAARDADTGKLTLSSPSSFRAVKAFLGNAPESPLIREAARGTLAPDAYSDAASIRLGNGFRFDPVADGEPQVPPALASKAVPVGHVGAFLVQLRGPVADGQRESLAAAGATIVSYVPNYAFLVRMPGESKADVEALPFVRWVGAYQPAYKLSAQPEMNDVSGPATLHVLLFPDADMTAAAGAVSALGGTVLESTDSGRNKLLRVSIDMAHVTSLASRSDVAWIEPWHETTLHNSNAQWVVQTNINGNRRVWDMGIHGEGQTVMTSDSGIRTSHNMFRDPAVTIAAFGDFPTHRKVISYQRTHEATNAAILFGDASGASYHGTHTAGTIVGEDSFVGGTDARDGMAPQAKIYFMDGGASANTISTPGDLNLMFEKAYVGNGGGVARISSNSWGGGTAGAYDVHCMTSDQFQWDHKDFLIFYSTGNAGTAGSVGSPATSKNSVGSGATANGTSASTIGSYTSRGPTADGRRKPTICAPGSSLSSASGASDTGFQSLTGTSMSCPAMAGATTLIRQYFTEGWYPTGAIVAGNAITPSAALLKAMAVASTANDMTGFTIPDNNVGWGRINADNILYFAGDTRRLAVVDDNDGLATGEFVEYEINVTDASVPLQIALCWTDKEGNPVSSVQLVNDLDLTVTEPNGTTVYLGNVFSGGQSTTGGASDALNVEEGVRRATPATGIWTVRVSGTNCPFSPQPFGLVVSGGMGQNNGFLQIDKLAYGQADLIEIRVEDTNASSPITVDVSSTTESTPEALSITGSNGVFVGTIATTAFSPAKNGGESAIAANGVLSVSHGDAITISYTDASPAATVTATATADFTGPVITNVEATDPPDGPTIDAWCTWTTDIQATSRVYYAISPAIPASFFEDSSLTTQHSIQIPGLLPDTTYNFDVESTDHGGNTTLDDHGGMHYQFTTDSRGDILLVIGDRTFEKDSLYTAALDNLGWSHDIYPDASVTPPAVGDTTSGMRAYPAVWWQVGYEQYPPFSNAARDSVTKYHDGGGRLSVVSHDVAWAFTDATSGYQNAARLAFLNNTLHVSWQQDPTTWSSIVGIAADPISGAYTGGIPYTPHRDGAAGDEINSLAGTGTVSYVWRNNDATPDDIAVRWTNGSNNGSADSAAWGGTPTKVVTNCLEWAQMTDAAARQDVLDKTLIWLIGRDHPDVVVTSPNGGETITTNTLAITGSTTFFGSTAQDTGIVSVSSDGGASWVPVGFFGPGSDPFTGVIDMTVFPNGAEYRVRVSVKDDGDPSLSGSDVSNANFTLDRTGGETRGPVVVAGSIVSSPNPQNNANPSTLTATVTDVGQGGSNVDAAEWSFGVSPAAAGSGTAMTGTFGTTTVAVSATIPALTVPAAMQNFWIRGHDAAGNWGSATALGVVVNGAATGVDGEARTPVRFALEQNSPNPFNPLTAIRYALPKASDVELAVFNASGERVRTLVSSFQTAGFQTVHWDGRNDRGEAVTSGVYLYQIKADRFEESRKMTLVK